MAEQKAFDLSTEIAEMMAENDINILEDIA